MARRWANSLACGSCSIRRLSSVAARLNVELLQQTLGEGVTMLRAPVECDANIIALNKPYGVLSHPNAPGSSSSSSSQSLLNCTYEHHDEYFYTLHPDGVEHRYYLCHRLDSHTSGLILLAHGKPLAQAIKEAFKRRRARKHYQARCFGSAEAFNGMLLQSTRTGARSSRGGSSSSSSSELEWTDEMVIARDAGKMRAADPSSHAPDRGRVMTARATARLSPLSGAGRDYPSVVLDLFPHTGFTHQLRYQCFKHGFPIVGDKTYGDKSSFGASRVFFSGGASAGAAPVNRLYLHSRSISLTYSFGGVKNRVFSAEAPAPSEFLLQPPAALAL